MSLNRERLGERAAYARLQVADLRRIVQEHQTGCVNVRDPIISAAVRYKLQTTIAALIDMAFHILAKRYLQAPKTAVDAFISLAGLGVVPQDDLPAMISMVRFRNRLVHGYLDVDDDRLFADLESDLEDVVRTLSALEAVTSADNP